MIKFKRLTIALAALLITSATAWAQTPGVAKLTAPSTWEEDDSPLTATDLSGFGATTEDIAKAIPNPNPTAAQVFIFFDFFEEEGDVVAKCIRFQNGNGTPTNIVFVHGGIYNGLSNGFEYYYTTAEPAGTPVAFTTLSDDKKSGTFTMPNGNVQVIVEYEPAYTATFKALTANTIPTGATVKLDNTAIDTLSAEKNQLNGIYEGQTITLTAQTGYKFRNVTATKGAAAAKPLGEVSAEDLGKVIGADGMIYANVDAATAAGTEGRALIAYVGSETDNTTYKQGLAIALADESGTMNWSTAKSTCEGKTAVSGAQWQLPSLNQWRTMFKANGGKDDEHFNLNSAITAAGGTVLKEGQTSYWTSTFFSESGYDDYYLMHITSSGANQSYDSTDTSQLVRAVLAF